MGGHQGHDQKAIYPVNTGEPVADRLAHPHVKRAFGDDVVIGKQTGDSLDRQCQQQGQNRPAAHGIVPQAAVRIPSEQTDSITPHHRRPLHEVAEA